MKILRSKVYVKDIKDQGALLCQDEVWLEDGRISRYRRSVVSQIEDVEIGQQLQGMIVKGLTTEPINDIDPGDSALYSEDGIILTIERYPIYKYYAYSPESSYQAYGECVYDDSLEEIIGGINR